MSEQHSPFGVLVLDKPEGMSSNRALQRVKRLFGAKKAGHGGCLDPLATGVLPLYIGEATKFSMYSLAAEKAYRVTAKLGETTGTGDSEGEVLEQREVPNLTVNELQEAACRFTGDIQQIPPMYSALKRDGQPLYRLARQGITVEREPRTVTIQAFSVVSYEAPYVVCDVQSSKGTYIRTLMEDLGERLGCGAHLTALRRTQSGVFSLDQSVTLETCEALASSGNLDSVLIPCEQALAHLPEYRVTDDQALALLQGKKLPLDLSFSPDVAIRLFSDRQGFIGLGEYRENALLTPKRMMNVLSNA